NGVSVGSTLRAPTDPHIRITITALRGLGQSEARVEGGQIKPGTLLEVSGWLVAPARPLRVWMPQIATSDVPIAGLARLLTMMAAKRGIQWISDPTTSTPAHLLRRGERGWELLAPGNRMRQFAANDGGAEDAISAIPRGSSLFVQLPAPASLIDAIAISEPIEPTSNPADADYIL